MELPDLVKACDLFVYLNVQFRSFSIRRKEQEVPSTFVANIHQLDAPNLDNLWLLRYAFMQSAVMREDVSPPKNRSV